MAELRENMATVLGKAIGCPDRKTIKSAMDGNDVQSHTVDCLRTYLARVRKEYYVYHHSMRYTGKVLPDELRREGMDARTFKGALVTALKCGNATEKDLDLLGLRLPQRIAFVNHTGQWLKPILRKLLQHPQGVAVEVYVCDPAKTYRLQDGKPEIVEVLGVLEFLWSLPTALELHRANKRSKLDVYTYDGSRHNRRLAYFEGDLIARSNHLPPMPKGKVVSGHPGTGEHCRCILGAETVDVILRGHPEFEEASDEIRQCLHEGGSMLEGLTPGKPRFSWSSAGFAGLQSDVRGASDLFDISPQKYLCDDARSDADCPPVGMVQIPMPKSTSNSR